MDRFSTYRDVIALWPSRKDFAADVGVSVAAVNKWCENDSIRGVYFHAIATASRRLHGADAVTPDDLCRLAARGVVARGGASAQPDAARLVAE